MKLSIYTLKEVLFEGQADKVVTRTPLGEIAVLENHIPLISTLAGPNVRIFNGDKNKEVINIKSGVIEVRPESEVVILAN